jgi:predicted phosphoadenosine phosphosulfate sulfurtransferase
MTLPGVKPYWYQMPIRLFNATSFKNDWLFCWEEGQTWMRKKDPMSIKVNTYGTDRFKDLFNEIIKQDFAGKKVANLAGVRAEESPVRFLTTTSCLIYKNLTYGRTMIKNLQYTFYPLYDWTYLDIWKYIQENKLPYNKIYDYQFQNGVGIQNMRVSNLHHETAVHALFYMQEIEPDTYQKLTQRLTGIDAANKMNKDDFWVTELPYMFKNWYEYRDYLLEHLIEPDKKHHFKKAFDRLDKNYGKDLKYNNSLKTMVNILVRNDWGGVTLHNLEVGLDSPDARRRRQDAKRIEEII